MANTMVQIITLYIIVFVSYCTLVFVSTFNFISLYLLYELNFLLYVIAALKGYYCNSETFWHMRLKLWYVKHTFGNVDYEYLIIRNSKSQVFVDLVT